MNKFRSTLKYCLEKHPIVTNSLIYGTLCISAEFFQQTVNKKILADKPESYDWPILLRYTIYGSSIGGPLVSTWYRFLDKKFIGTTGKIVTKKLLVDQFTFTPLLLVVFYTSMSIMERKEDVLEECRLKLLPTFQMNCMFWIPMQSINFLFIPPIYRVSYISFCSFMWINILCLLKRRSSE